ncbi:hypothetical protein FE257_010018 [Aspergillus nanangensis]|uniref:ER-bound oxygenase mpaB/mpaB'/Rubber oxygenase catalytic domain-containing protein n=1 Tax=Aspergillus nanangensis TaxID=2582783 RepID=A0AAD4GZN2_ASPNN|nr:hypothetical protein FE257_010018 [Aspergillus nanangensis]
MWNLVQQQCSPWIVLSLGAYLLLVQLLRTRNLRNLHEKHAQYIPNPYSMDYKTAHEILKNTLLREFPFMHGFGTQWALVKSYGIASGTKLLVQTRRLTTPSKVGKRSEDTGVLLGEVLISGIDSPRGREALAKMNWIHRQYGARIGNDEMIHTLVLFVLEPQRWVDCYEWRTLSELERVAYFVYWREIGSRMGMRGIPETLEDLRCWAHSFEKTHMVYAESNRLCTVATMDLFVRGLPGFMQDFAKTVMACFLEPHVRPTLGVKEPPPAFVAGVEWLFWVRRMVIRWLLLPRFHDMSILSSPDQDTGRINRKAYLFEPWYVPEDTWSTVRKKLLGSSRPLPGPEYMSEGYLPRELGPTEYKERSKEPVEREAEEMRQYALKGGASGMGCPFSFGG